MPLSSEIRSTLIGATGPKDPEGDDELAACEGYSDIAPPKSEAQVTSGGVVPADETEPEPFDGAGVA